MSRVYVSREHFQVFIFPTKYVSRKTRQYLKPLRKQNQKISLEDVKPLQYNVKFLFIFIHLIIFQVQANGDTSLDVEGNGRNFFPVDTSAADEAGFRLPVADLASEGQFGESRVPRLIGGPPPSGQTNEDDLAIVIVGSSNNENDEEEERAFTLDDGR